MANSANIDNWTERGMVVVHDFMRAHGIIALPALVGAIVGVATELGAGDLICTTLKNAIDMSQAAEKAYNKEAN